MLNDSFFNFFNPPAIQDEEELDSDTEALLDSDFQIGSTFKVYKDHIWIVGAPVTLIDYKLFLKSVLYQLNFRTV